MGIDYVVDYDCEPKRALGLDRILELLKDRSRAVAALELLRRGGVEAPPNDSSSSSSSRGRPRATWRPAASGSRTSSTGPPRSRSSPPPARAPGEQHRPRLRVRRLDRLPALPDRRCGSSAASSGAPEPTSSARSSRSSLDRRGHSEDARRRRTFFEARTAPRREDLGFALATDQLLEAFPARGTSCRLTPPSSSLALSALRLERPVPSEEKLPPGSAMLVGKDENGARDAQLFDIPPPVTRTTTPLES